MDKILVWDFPSRIIHWLFAGSLSAALAIAFLVDDEQPIFKLHMVLGIVAVFSLAVRVLLGIVGSRYSRFANFPLRPREVATYFVNAVFSKTKRYAGNNPGSAIAAVLMFLIVPGLFLTGSIANDSLEDVHEVLAWGLLLVVISHLAGLGWHTFRHRENISLAMITGRKAGEPAEATPSSHPIWGGLILLASGLWISLLLTEYRTSDRDIRLPGLGMTIQLGENKARDGDDD
ncbi:MAG: cytochrome b/b6 domain-containing protein [Planctomycetota bacterium]|jgi:cytochrome b|nr:cytochrome b/b6 domain-containing protein [Planctomycetota bacterium]